MHTKPLALADEARGSGLTSAAFLSLQSAFLNLRTPYDVDGAVRFNLMFSHLYPQLSPAERHRAEALVDTLMANLEQRTLGEQVADLCKAQGEHRTLPIPPTR